MSDAKLIRKTLNASRAYGLRGDERANATTCLALSDAVREAGDEGLADLWAGVAELMAALEEHQRACWGRADTVAYASDRRAFVAVDLGYADGTSGTGFVLVEKATGLVWSIKGYGKKNRVMADGPRALAALYREAVEAHRRRAAAAEQPAAPGAA